MHTLKTHCLSIGERADIVQWLHDFAAAVRNRDYAAGRSLCDPQIMGFGSVCSKAQDITELEAHQWRQVWGRTSGFEFDSADIHCGGGGGQYWVATSWTSRGVRESGETFERRGRTTIILRENAGRLLAVHTHYSMDPVKATCCGHTAAPRSAGNAP